VCSNGGGVSTGPAARQRSGSPGRGVDSGEKAMVE
jgi:hypothetical protein